MTSLYSFQPSSVFFSSCKTVTLGPDLQVCICPSPHLWFFMQNSHIWTSIQVSIGTRPHLSGCAYKTAWSAPELLVYIGSSPNLWLCAFKTATLGQKLHVSMGPRHHLWFSAWKTACLASELLVSMCRSPHVWFLDAKQRILDWNKMYLSLRCNLSFCACKPAWFAPEWQVHMDSSPHLWFLSCKSATLKLNLQVCMGLPDLICDFEHTQQRA